MIVIVVITIIIILVILKNYNKTSVASTCDLSELASSTILCLHASHFVTTTLLAALP